MRRLVDYLRSWATDVLAAWSRFWFQPSDPATLGAIRICTGAMLLYTHLVWSLALVEFFGPESWLSPRAVALLQQDTYAWSYFWWFQSRAALWTVHIIALVVFALFTVGLFTRVTSILSLVATLAYIGRVPGALFGLDQINVILTTYLAVGPSGSAFSVDRVLASRRAGQPLPIASNWTANLAIRLMQLHMCIIYFFAGTAKLTGAAWWDGTAMWMALGNMEYQSTDMTWLANWPSLINVMTHVTVFWELTYWALVWPRLTRPFVILMAIPLHMGIAICLGMTTFGLIMLVGNMAFIPPSVFRGWWTSRATQQGRGGAESTSTRGQAKPSGSKTAQKREHPAQNPH